jgi:hypothetical protein
MLPRRHSAEWRHHIFRLCRLRGRHIPIDSEGAIETATQLTTPELPLRLQKAANPHAPADPGDEPLNDLSLSSFHDGIPLSGGTTYFVFAGCGGGTSPSTARCAMFYV